jgi:hypothetical protein
MTRPNGYPNGTDGMNKFKFTRAISFISILIGEEPTSYYHLGDTVAWDGKTPERVVINCNDGISIDTEGLDGYKVYQIIGFCTMHRIPMGGATTTRTVSGKEPQ